ncbi:MAG: hypothetical protein ACREKQ_15130 [Candidatus Rokuibacteriota bacterium]
MANVCPDRQFDRVSLELACGCGTPDPARVLSAGVVGDCPALRGRAGGKRIAQSLGELTDVLLVHRLPTLRCSLAGSLARLRICQALSFRLRESRLLDQHSLTFVSLSRPTESKDHRTEGRVCGGTAGQRRITAGEKDEVIEVGAGKAEGPFPFHPEKAPLCQLTAAFRTCRIAEDREDEDVAWISTGLKAASST